MSLATAITLLIALSIASERVVEITKGLVPWLDRTHADPRTEGFRRAALHGLAAAAGIAISWLAWPIIAEGLSDVPGQATRPLHVPTVLALGFLASGGSGFWNSVLGYAVSLKSLKQTVAREQAAQVKASAIPAPLEGRLQP